MKRKIMAVLLVILAVFSVSIQVMASSDTQVVNYFDDGSYLIETVYTSPMRASGNVSGYKEGVYYGSDGTVDWKAVLTGSFTYTGSSATCTSSSCNVYIYNSSWYTVSKSAGKTGANATASVTMGYKVLGVTVNKVSTDITLICDANGKLS